MQLLTLLTIDLHITSNAAKLSSLGFGQGGVKHGWLPLAMTDTALFHLILSGSALYVDLLTGRKESPEKFKHMKEAIHLLSMRLQDPGFELSEGTIVAVSHLAEFEASTYVHVDLSY